MNASDDFLEAIGDRLLQRLMLAKEQHPVNISRAGVALINNVMGFMVVPWRIRD